MDSMRADLIRGLETSLLTSFDKEVFFATIASGNVDGAEEYLSDFTKIDSNYYSNLMFFLLKRQKFFKLLVAGDNWGAGLLMFNIGEEMALPETREFIDSDVNRIVIEGLLKWEDARRFGYTCDILSVANSFTDEMFTMMNQLIPMNPDLHKKEGEEYISSQMHKLHLPDNQTTMLGVAGPAAVAFNGGEMNKDE